jgi:hypothetical protein
MERLDLGRAAVSPRSPLVAGSWTTRVFTYTAGHPIDDTGHVKIAFRFAGDFGVPQFTDPAGENFCAVSTTGRCRIEPRWDPKGHTRPWDRCLVLKIVGGYLARGETIGVVFGDRSRGSPGWQAQTFCETTFEFKTLVDPIATYEFKELPGSPVLRIVAGPPVRAACVAPSRVETGRRFPYFLKLEDAWGNPTQRPRRLVHTGFAQEGIHRVEARDAGTGMAGSSNPIRAAAPGDPSLEPFWADLHGQSEETIGSNSIEAYFRFARDFGLLDVSAHQGNDFQVTDDFWKTVNRTTRAFYRPGRFVTFPGYEWSGNTPLGGDRNVFFRAEGGEIVHSCVDLLPGKRSDHPTAATADDLFRALRKQARRGPFVIAHVGGRYADLDMHDPETEVAVEIHSAWGTFEWLAGDALERGYRIGICANSDGHKGRPGASYPGARKFGSLGGLTCVLARQRVRGDICRALRARHFYATTGNRPLLEVRVVSSDGVSAMMGDVLSAGDSALRLRVEVAGTAPVERVEVRNGTQTIRTLRPYGNGDLGSRIKLLWSGAEVRGRGRMVSWDGSLTVRHNSLSAVRPVNFWNPLTPPRPAGRNRVEWRSTTTGGHAGLILTLGRPLSGDLEIRTEQRTVACSVGSVGMRPKTWDCGGLDKRLSVYRLPDPPGPSTVSFALPLNRLRPGDNPIWVRVDQEDGHVAWSSPVYLVK